MRAQIIAAVLSTLSLGACGTYVPDIQEFPGGTLEGQALVRSILHNINCEITEAVQYIIEQDKQVARRNQGQRTAKWLEDWGVQTTLSLTLDEKGSINPVVNWLPSSPANAIFNLAGAGTFSSEGMRIDKINSYNTVQDFLAYQCVDRPNGLWLLSSDLKLREWIIYVIAAAASGEITLPAKGDGPFKTNVLSHEVKFVVFLVRQPHAGVEVDASLDQSERKFLSSEPRQNPRSDHHARAGRKGRIGENFERWQGRKSRDARSLTTSSFFAPSFTDWISGKRWNQGLAAAAIETASSEQEECHGEEADSKKSCEEGQGQKTSAKSRNGSCRSSLLLPHHA
jgi:hypothetical protein